MLSEGRVPSVTVTVFVAPLLWTVRVELVARLLVGHCAAEVVARVHLGVADLRDDVAGLEPGLRGCGAGRDLRDARAVVGVGKADAEERALDRLAGDERVRDLLGGLDRHGVADALVAAGLRRDLRVDADHAAVAVEQRAAAVAGVDRGVGLDRAVDREAVGRGQLAVDRADDARGDGALEPERAADRHDRIADLHGLGRAERRAACRSLGTSFSFSTATSADAIRADDRRAPLVAVRERDGDALRAVDHVLVRDDVALGVDHEAAAGGAAATLLAEGRLLRGGTRAHLHDAVLHAFVDRVDRPAGRRRDRRRRRGLRGSGGLICVCRLPDPDAHTGADRSGRRERQEEDEEFSEHRSS